MTFFYDGWNLIEERIAYTNGTSSTIRYFWGKDLSGTLQGAGGVGGLLYLTIDGVPFVPDYDNIGNITRYLDANGNSVAQYTYDAFGGTVSQSGSLASFFRHRFSTKYLDIETGLYYYGYRFYHPPNRRWLNRDPIEEKGGNNLYVFCSNNSIAKVDYIGLFQVVFHRFGEPPPEGWGHPGNLGVTITKFRHPKITGVTCQGKKRSYRVVFNPHESRSDIYLHESLSIRTIDDELEHVQCAKEYDKAFDSFKSAVEAICECPDIAESLYNDAAEKLRKAEEECKRCNERLDAKGGPHGH